MSKIILKIITWFRGLFKRKYKPDNTATSAHTKNASVSKLIPKKMSWKEWKVFRKANITPRRKLPCGYCKEPLLVSVGQIALWHRACRTLGRNRNARIRHDKRLRLKMV